MYAILAVLLLSFVFLLVGRAVMAVTHSQQKGMATMFFAGELVSVCVFGLAARMATLQAAFFCWIIIALLCIGYVLFKIRMHWPRLSSLLVWLGLAVAVTGILLFWWNMPADAIPDPVMEHNGSIHTGRSLAISGYMTDQNHLTGIGQNFGQSLLLCLTQKTGVTPTPLTITIWIAVNAAFLMLLLYEIFTVALNNKRLAIAGTAFVMFCGVSLSLTWNNLVDIGNPFIISGYVDNYLGLASLLLLGYILFETKNQQHRLSVWQIAFMIILIFGNHIYAPQNLVVLLALLVILLLYKSIKKQWHSARRLFFWNMVVVVIMASGYFFGGMFLDKKRMDDRIPFASQVNGQLRLLPHLSSKMYNEGVFTFRKGSTVPGIGSDTGTAASHTGNLKLAAAHLEADIWESLRLVFFPLALLLLSAVVMGSNPAAHRWWKRLTVAGLAFFACAWPIAYLFAIGPYKMELNRFLYPFILCGLMTWPFLLQQYSTQKRVRWALWGCGVAGIIPFFTELIFRLTD